MIDALPEEWWPVAVAVTAALLDDPAAADVARPVDAPAVRDRWTAAARDALRDPELATPSRSGASRPRALRSAGSGADTATRAATDEYFERYVARGPVPGRRAARRLDRGSQAAGV